MTNFVEVARVDVKVLTNCCLHMFVRVCVFEEQTTIVDVVGLIHPMFVSSSTE
jgi:hypothetical protein